MVEVLHHVLHLEFDVVDDAFQLQTPGSNVRNHHFQHGHPSITVIGEVHGVVGGMRVVGDL